MLKTMIKERLMAAADEIFALFERTIASYEEELSRTKEKDRHRQQLEALAFDDKDVQQPPRIKDEEEELWTTQEEADLAQLPLTGVSVKTENDEEKPPESSQLHREGAEPPSSSSHPQETTEAEGDHCGGSQPDKLLAPLSDSEDGDRDDTQDALSSDTDWAGDIRTHADSQCSEKKTRKKRFTCSICDKTFHFRSNLARHMWTHSKEKPFSCPVCAKSFSHKRNLTRHALTHTGEKHFSCSVCGDKFAYSYTLARHMRTHTGEKPFACSVCGKSYSQKSNMVAHTKTHSGEKPFSCSICGKRFTQKVNVASHLATHAVEKPFRCSVCSKSFCYQKSLTAHMLAHNVE
ncbi:gastrula zinc finger protein xFG20-1-like [Nerophis ophidion]|uniref:gastrula zinc finger protein xFG20-1-like n=1 Tax=Nerophis ophidion TaxID=159077 RepID=UPI002AE09641|nr:gastrula zinc finger protein xFG20-1-like [Nerophis ophidion]